MQKTMSQRTCGSCRWYIDKTGGVRRAECYRYPRVWTSIGWCLPSPDESSTCGEWADRYASPEQDERRKLVRQFAVAIVQGDSAPPVATSARLSAATIWSMAEQMADAEPKP